MSEICDIYATFSSYRRALDETMTSIKGDEEAIPYSKDDILYTRSVEAAKQQFGASFRDAEHPMNYYPDNDDVVLSGDVGALQNVKFQYRYREPSNEGCYIWCDALQLSQINLDILKKVYGVFANWKNMLDTTEDKTPISYHKKVTRGEGV